ncbi:MAG: radical SAM protein [Candidatus Levybacteria bacterium]|nr:radical SAM protein [Candidatus Levybacteria bacterium]
MKIQLIHAPFLQKERSGAFQPTIWPPIGIMYLASYLRKNFKGKLRIKLTDGGTLGEDKTLEEIKNFNPDILGISSFTPNSTGGYYLTNEVKKILPETFIIFGGVHASALPEDVYKSANVDLVAIGEGEQTFLEVVKAVSQKKKNFEKIPGLAILKRGKVIRTPPRQFIKNLDDLPFPTYDLIDNLDKYHGWFFRKNYPDTAFMSTRGCPYHCFFCTDAVWKSSKPYLRVRSPKNVADELEWLTKKYGYKEYFDLADEFNCIESWAIDVCREIKKRKLGITWKCQLRADKVSDELAKNLAEAGCWYVHLGVESGNQRTLDGINKKITIEQVEKACKNFKKYGIKVYLLMMIFNIWEEKGELAFEGVKESLNNLKFARHLIDKGLADFLGWSPTTPYPGGQLYPFAIKHNLIPQHYIGSWEKWNNIWGIPLKLPGISRYDYQKVKVLGTIFQFWYFFKKMRNGINHRTVAELTERAIGNMSAFWKLAKARF